MSPALKRLRQQLDSQANKEQRSSMRPPFDEDEFLVDFFDMVEVDVIVGLGSTCKNMRRHVAGYAARHMARGGSEETKDEAPGYAIMGERARQAALLRNRTIATSKQQTLVCCRNGTVYAFGHQTRLDASTPRVIEFPPLPFKGAGRVKIAQVAASIRHSVALCAMGHVYAWGANHRGQLGLGGGVAPTRIPHRSSLGKQRQKYVWDTWTSPPPKTVIEPRRLETLAAGQRIVEIACGDEHTLLLADDGRVRACGSAQVVGVGVKDIFVPSLLWRLADRGVVITRVAAARHHSLALSSEGDVFSWGVGDGGRLGHGDDEPRLEPTLVRTLCGERVTHVDCGAECSCAYAAEPNKFFWWGCETSSYAADYVDVGSWRRPTLCPSALPEDDTHDKLGLFAVGGSAATGLVVAETSGRAFLLTRMADGALARRPLDLPASCVAAVCSDEHLVCATDDGAVYAAGHSDHAGGHLSSHAALAPPTRVAALSDVY